MSKYYRWYHAIMKNTKSQGRCKKKDDVYYESHHIVPVSLGGNNFESNLVLLTAREHYIAHLLLVHMTEGLDKEKMVRASLMMVAQKKEKRYTSRSWAIHREYLANCLSENHRNNKAVEIDGVSYRSMKEASRKLGVSVWVLQKQGKLPEKAAARKYKKPPRTTILKLNSYEVAYLPPTHNQNIKPLLVIDNVTYDSKNAAAKALGVTPCTIQKLMDGTYVLKAPVVLNGVEYKSINHASGVLKKAPHTIQKMIDDPDFVPEVYAGYQRRSWGAKVKKKLRYSARYKKSPVVIEGITYSSQKKAADTLGWTIHRVKGYLIGKSVPEKPTVMINGIVYKSINKASEILRKAPHTIKKMMADPNFVPETYRVRAPSKKWSPKRRVAFNKKYP